LKLPPAEPVAKKNWSEFTAARDHATALFPAEATLVARRSGAEASPTLR